MLPVAGMAAWLVGLALAGNDGAFWLSSVVVVYWLRGFVGGLVSLKERGAL